MDWELGVSRCKIVYIGWVSNKVLLYSIRNCVQYPLSDIMEKNIFIIEPLCCTAVINTVI